jgi:aryl sulfotransferase
MDRTVDWPRKTRELHSHHFDSTIWNDFRFRDDDIVIATYAQCARWIATGEGLE